MFTHQPIDRPADRSPAAGSALAMLAADHERFIQLAEEYQVALEDDSDDQGQLAEQICRELEIHCALEEEILYPAAARITELALLVGRGRGDHRHAKEIIEDVRRLGARDSQVSGLIMQLAEEVENHIAEEEDVLFPEIERRMARELGQLGAQMERLRARLSAIC